ncbi:MAG TPA: efflux RND transporter periplasmic adaptor subunit [Planctomycetota bacterium]|nr:efflux RND transporter periplasmic adaptor subunit [Planctomycetota bacterium]
MNATNPRKAVGRPRVRGVLLLAAGLAVGLAAGLRWHDTVAGWMGAADEQGATGPGAMEARQLWTCSMHPQVLQDQPGSCPICGMALTPVKNHGAAAGAPSAGAQGAAGQGERRIKYWWDPMMSPPYISPAPGKSPMGMDLVPVYEDEVLAGEAVTIDPVVVQNMGVRVATVSEAPLRRSVRAVGFLREPEPRRHEVNLRVSGWVERLYADTEGMEVRQGEPLFDLYSPEVVVAVEELIAARRARETEQAAGAAATGPAGRLFEAAVAKLRLWGLDEEQIGRLAAMDRAPRTVPITSPISGHVMEKHVVAGAAVQAGEPVMALSDRSTMWLDVAVFEADLPFVTLGRATRATVEAFPGRDFEGTVTFIHPHLAEMTRTALARIELPNPGHELRMGMYATALIEAELAPRAILVPREAILDTGERQIAFVSLGGGRFEPRRLGLGASADDGMVAVHSGLAPGEQVVTSGQFLLDSESRLREAIAKQLSEGLLVPPDAGQDAADPPAPPGHQHR